MHVIVGRGVALPLPFIYLDAVLNMMGLSFLKRGDSAEHKSSSGTLGAPMENPPQVLCGVQQHWTPTSPREQVQYQKKKSKIVRLCVTEVAPNMQECSSIYGSQ